MTNLVPGSQHTVTLKYGTTKAGKHAYDYLTTWNYSENWITDADLCQDFDANGAIPRVAHAPSGALTTSSPIPDDPNPAFTAETPDVRAAGRPQLHDAERQHDRRDDPSRRQWHLRRRQRDGDHDHLHRGQRPGCLRGTGANTTCSIALWFGAHIALTDQWTSGGATTVFRSPYHVALDKVDSASVGQRDNQMQANTIVAAGNLVLTKALTGGPAATPDRS